MQKEEELTKKESEIQSTEAAREACKVDYEKELRTLRELSGRMGGLSVRLRSYDKVEQRFYDRYLKKSADMELARNLLGEYEEGTLALYNRKFEEELTQLNVELGRYSEELHRLKAEEEALIEESESLSLHSSQCEHELMQLKKEYQSMQEEKERRRGILRYMELADAEIDNKGWVAGWRSWRRKGQSVQRSRRLFVRNMKILAKAGLWSCRKRLWSILRIRGSMLSMAWNG